MLGNIQAMILVGWRLCKLYDGGKMTPGHASLGKVVSNLCGSCNPLLSFLKPNSSNTTYNYLLKVDVC